MSSPRHGWWGYVKNMIRRYPNEDNDDERAAVDAAIEQTERMITGRDRMKVVEMVLIKQTHTLAGAALQVPCHYDTAQAYRAEV